MSLPALRREPHPERPEPLVGNRPVGLAQRYGLGLRIPALAEVPQALAASPSDDGDEAAAVEELEHDPDVSVAVPARVTLLRRVVFKLAREHRPVLLEL